MMGICRSSSSISGELQRVVPDEHIVSEWRLLSGRAHGLIWPLHYLPDPPPESSDPRFVTAPIAMWFGRMLGSVHNALVMVNCAVDYYTDMVKAAIVA